MSDRNGPGAIGWFILALIVVLSFAAGRASAATYIISKNDRGGYLLPAYRAMVEKNAGGHRVEIRSRLCLSSCVLHLGAWDLCISSYTVFGLHSAGGTDDQRAIDAANRLIADAISYHATELGEWFLSIPAKGQRVHRKTGAELISAYGYEECQRS